MEAGTAITLEELRSRLSDLEARQRAAGGVADAAWAASVRAGHGLGDGGGRAGVGEGQTEHVWSEPAPLATAVDADGVVWENVDARLSSSLDVASQIARAWQAPLSFCREGDLLDTVGVLARLSQARDLLLVRVVTELEARGVDSPGGLSRIDWLRSLDPSLTAATARSVVTVAGAAAAGQAPSPFDDASAAARRALHQALVDDVLAGSVPVGNAAQIIDLGQRLDPVADPSELHHALEHLIGQAAKLRPEELARACRLHADQLRPPKDLDELDDARRGARGLWFSRPNRTGMVNLKGVLDPENAAIVQGAIDPLAAPRPLVDEDTGATIEPDPRPAHQRRLDALVEIIGRGVAAPGEQPSTDKAKIVVTIDYDTLARTLTASDRTPGVGSTGCGRRSGAAPGSRPESGPGCGPGSLSGVSASGDVLSPTTVRRLACDASLIAAVLGTQGEPLDVGRRHRLVTPAIRTALVLRDKGCSFPGCTVPAAWTDAHHVTHWIDGGPTSLENLALLCRRHHLHVHRHGLTATVTGARVSWHTWQQWRRDWRSRGHPTADLDPAARRSAAPCADPGP